VLHPNPFWLSNVANPYRVNSSVLASMPQLKALQSRFVTPMTTRSNEDGDKKHWWSVHVCPKCAFVTNLSEIDLKTVTTGIINCPRCDWSGPVEIKIAEVDEADEE
jgi:ssDNA-binding Zn-finger/Zn-ribbon topoisomerase 1